MPDITSKARLLLRKYALWVAICVWITALWPQQLHASVIKKKKHHSHKIKLSQILSKSVVKGGRYFRKVKLAVSKTAYPKTLLAIAKVESTYDPNAVAKDGRGKGLYQMREDLHGPVPKSIEGQTKKAEGHFIGLVEKYGYSRAIARWCGTGEAASDYYQKVMIAMQDPEIQSVGDTKRPRG